MARFRSGALAVASFKSVKRREREVLQLMHLNIVVVVVIICGGGVMDDAWKVD